MEVDKNTAEARRSSRSLDYRDWLSVESFILNSFVRCDEVNRAKIELGICSISSSREKYASTVSSQRSTGQCYSVQSSLERKLCVKTRAHCLSLESKRAKYSVQVKYFGCAFSAFAWDKGSDWEKGDDDARERHGERFYEKGWRAAKASVIATVRAVLKKSEEFGIEEEPVVHQSGRTDRNVSGYGQILQVFRNCEHAKRRYRDEKEEEKVAEIIRKAINEGSVAGKRGYLRAGAIFRANAEWHANFSATWRRYVYVVPKRTLSKSEIDFDNYNDCNDDVDGVPIDDEIDCEYLNEILQALENKTIDMYAFGRDLAKGKSTECKMIRARAKTIFIPKYKIPPQKRNDSNINCKRFRDRRNTKDSKHSVLFDIDDASSSSVVVETAAEENSKVKEEEELLECVAIELVADRFLRKMVRCIVSTACREASKQSLLSTSRDREILLKFAKARDRASLAPPAPPYGLLFCAVGYDDDHYNADAFADLTIDQ